MERKAAYNRIKNSIVKNKYARCMEQYPQIELWGEDGQHPSLEGSYLAACAAYAVIFQESPEGCTYTADLEEGTAANLQTLAAGFLAE